MRSRCPPLPSSWPTATFPTAARYALAAAASASMMQPRHGLPGRQLAWLHLFGPCPAQLTAEAVPLTATRLRWQLSKTAAALESACWHVDSRAPEHTACAGAAKRRQPAKWPPKRPRRATCASGAGRRSTSAAGRACSTTHQRLSAASASSRSAVLGVHESQAGPYSWRKCGRCLLVLTASLLSVLVSAC